MPRLYLANTSKQRQNIPYAPSHRAVAAGMLIHHEYFSLEPGAQGVLPGQHDQKWIMDLINLNRRYGWLPLDELSRNRQFVGVIFSIDKAITESNISHMLEENDDILDDEAMNEQSRTAIAASGMTTNLTGNEPNEVDLTIEELPTSLAGHRKDEEDREKTTFKVRRDAPTKTSGKRAGRRRAA